MEQLKLSFRIDDVGASSKKYEVYSNKPFGNFLFLKTLPGFRAWGPYREISLIEWETLLTFFKAKKAKLTVSITAAWVESDNSLIPFPKKFAAEAGKLKEGLDEGIIEIANHGLTHCVVGEHLPKLFSSNRTNHREFWDWLPSEIHYDHLRHSQDILQDFFKTEVVTLVPPGNVFSLDTIEAAVRCNIKVINCQNPPIATHSKVKILNDGNIKVFHDREIKLYGIQWMEKLFAQLPEKYETCFIKDRVLNG